MNPTLVQFFRCPACRAEVELWDVREERDGEVVEGTIACQTCGVTYLVQARVPILLPPGRRAVDDFATLLALESQHVGFAEGIRRLADGEIEYPIHDPYGRPVTPSEASEARYRETEAFWDTFSRNRLVQQQMNAIDQHWDAVEEMWLRAEVNLADSILDVRTAWGGTFHRLLERGPQDALVVALDTAFLNLKIAHGRCEREELTHGSFVVGDIAVPPFAPALFESVVSWFGLGSQPRFHAALDGVERVLAPGHAFAAAWTPSMYDDMEGLAGVDVLQRLAARLDIPLDLDDALRVAEQAGFEEVEVTPVGPIYVLSGRAPLGGPSPHEQDA